MTYTIMRRRKNTGYVWRGPCRYIDKNLAEEVKKEMTDSASSFVYWVQKY